MILKTLKIIPKRCIQISRGQSNRFDVRIFDSKKTKKQKKTEWEDPWFLEILNSIKLSWYSTSLYNTWPLIKPGEEVDKSTWLWQQQICVHKDNNVQERSTQIVV